MVYLLTTYVVHDLGTLFVRIGVESLHQSLPRIQPMRFMHWTITPSGPVSENGNKRQRYCVPNAITCEGRHLS